MINLSLRYCVEFSQVLFIYSSKTVHVGKAVLIVTSVNLNVHVSTLFVVIHVFEFFGVP